MERFDQSDASSKWVSHHWTKTTHATCTVLMFLAVKGSKPNGSSCLDWVGFALLFVAVNFSVHEKPGIFFTCNLFYVCHRQCLVAVPIPSNIYCVSCHLPIRARVKYMALVSLKWGPHSVIRSIDLTGFIGGIGVR